MNNFEYKENNEQFVVSVGLQSKANSIHELNKDYEPRYKDEVVVVKTITLSDKDFERFINHLLDDYNFIQDYVRENHYNIEVFNIDYARLDKVMLITSQGVDFGIIVDTQGYNYARYTAYYKKIKTPHERLLELGFVVDDETNYFITYMFNGLGIILYKKEKTYQTYVYRDNYNPIGLELAEILVDYLKELQNE